MRVFFKNPILVTILIIFVTGCGIKNSNKCVCIGNNVNFRSSPEKADNVLFQCNIGDILEIIEIPNYNTAHDNPNDFWMKCGTNGKTGWINARFVAKDFAFINGKKSLTWVTMKNRDGIINSYEVILYDLQNKTIVQKNNIQCSYIIRCDDNLYTYSGFARGNISVYTNIGFKKINTIEDCISDSIYEVLGLVFFKKIISHDNDNIKWKEFVLINGKSKSICKTGVDKNIDYY
jgi:hypothetical protein